MSKPHAHAIRHQHRQRWPALIGIVKLWRWRQGVLPEPQLHHQIRSPQRRACLRRHRWVLLAAVAVPPVAAPEPQLHHRRCPGHQIRSPQRRACLRRPRWVLLAAVAVPPVAAPEPQLHHRRCPGHQIRSPQRRACLRRPRWVLLAAVAVPAAAPVAAPAAAPVAAPAAAPGIEFLRNYACHTCSNDSALCVAGTRYLQSHYHHIMYNDHGLGSSAAGNERGGLADLHPCNKHLRSDDSLGNCADLVHTSRENHANGEWCRTRSEARGIRELLLGRAIQSIFFCAGKWKTKKNSRTIHSTPVDTEHTPVKLKHRRSCS